MSRKRSGRVPGVLIAGVISLVVAITPMVAQDHGHADVDVTCDVDAMIEHQQEHAQALDGLAEALEHDPEEALYALYVTGIAYQALALQCGFTHGSEAEVAHEAEHERLVDPAALDAALAIGDPENGRDLFNTIQPEVAFACATCHLTESTDRLVGPGLLGIGDPGHDPSDHAPDEAHMPGMSDMHETMPGADEADDSMAAMPMGDPAAYIRESILDPNAYVVPGFPADLMPRTYGDIFTEEEIDDLVAYLLTLR